MMIIPDNYAFFQEDKARAFKQNVDYQLANEIKKCLLSTYKIAYEYTIRLQCSENQKRFSYFELKYSEQRKRGKGRDDEGKEKKTKNDKIM